MMCGVGSWRRSGQWWSVTPWWCWSPSTCTSSEVCLRYSDRSWACQRKGEFLWPKFVLNIYVHVYEFSLNRMAGLALLVHYHLTFQSPWSGFGTVRHSGAVCTYPASCCVPIGLYPSAALLQLRLPDSHWPRQCTCQTSSQVRWQEYVQAEREYPTLIK